MANIFTLRARSPDIQFWPDFTPYHRTFVGKSERTVPIQLFMRCRQSMDTGLETCRSSTFHKTGRLQSEIRQEVTLVDEEANLAFVLRQFTLGLCSDCCLPLHDEIALRGRPLTFHQVLVTRSSPGCIGPRHARLTPLHASFLPASIARSCRVKTCGFSQATQHCGSIDGTVWSPASYRKLCLAWT